MLDQTIKNLRRLLQNVRPSYIETLGLTPALEGLTAQNSQTNKVDIRLVVEGTARRLPANHELGLYRIAQEAITNALRHAQATRIEVKLCFGKNVVLSIQDDGCGFSVPERPGTLAQNGHYGLMGMVERAEQMQAQFRIDSQAGKGTLIEISLAAG
jgi:signal transduction histidine kinase